MCRRMARSGLFYTRFMDDILVLAQTRWRLRKAVKAVNEVLGSLRMEKHPEPTAAYCWKQAKLANSLHSMLPYWVDQLLSVRVPVPDMPLKVVRGPSVVHLSHKLTYPAVVPSAFVPVQKRCNPKGSPVGSMSMACRIDPSVRSVKSSAIFVPSGST